MGVQSVEKEIEYTFDDEELEYKINIATQTLERNINFVSTCDNKTSIILTIVGVLFAIILTSDGINLIFNIVKSCIYGKTFCDILYLISFIASALLMGYGIFSLVTVLFGRTNRKKSFVKSHSRIFFSGIVEYADNKEYKKNFYSMTRQELLNDLITEIYINAEIAKIKYQKYNIGLKFSIIGFLLFVSILFIGIYIY